MPTIVSINAARNPRFLSPTACFASASASAASRFSASFTHASSRFFTRDILAAWKPASKKAVGRFDVVDVDAPDASRDVSDARTSRYRPSTATTTGFDPSAFQGTLSVSVSSIPARTDTGKSVCSNASCRSVELRSTTSPFSRDTVSACRSIPST